jgi:hypothetical protein
MVLQFYNHFTNSSKPALSIKKNNETEKAIGPQMQGITTEESCTTSSKTKNPCYGLMNLMINNYSIDDLNKVANPLEEARSTEIFLRHYLPRTTWPNPSPCERPCDSAITRHLYTSNR